ncbi:MAG: cell wall hydrolase [Clostridia bacterium]|nr:cell wall hydrolase [Clostridia bacterium]
MKLRKMLLLITAFMCFSAIGTKAQTPVDIYVNGTLIDTKSRIYIKNDYTMVPARKMSEILGSKSISWNDNTKTVTIDHNSDIIEFKIGNKSAYINGVKHTMPVEAEIKDNKTYVSARFICENMGAKISWDNKTHSVYVNKNDITVNEEDKEDSYTKEDIDWLAKIVHAEAQGETHEGKVAVANVVLNRTESKDFPNTIYEVVFDKKYGVQFTPTINGAIYNNPSKESYSAAKQAINGNNVAGNSLYFLNPKKASSLWIINNRRFYKSIGNHDFYL